MTASVKLYEIAKHFRLPLYKIFIQIYGIVLIDFYVEEPPIHLQNRESNVLQKMLIRYFSRFLRDFFRSLLPVSKICSLLVKFRVIDYLSFIKWNLCHKNYSYRFKANN